MVELESHIRGLEKHLERNALRVRVADLSYLLPHDNSLAMKQQLAVGVSSPAY